MARIVIRSEILSKAEQMADHVAEEIEKSNEQLEAGVTVLGPSTAPVEKLRGKFRFHMLLSSCTAGELQQVVEQAKRKIKSIEDVQWIVDIDPQDML